MWTSFDKLLIVGLLFIGSIQNHIMAAPLDSDYEITQSFYDLVVKSKTDPRPTIDRLDRYFENFKNLTESPISPKKKAIKLHARLNTLNHFVWINVSVMPKFLFKFVISKINQSRLSLSRYQMYAKNPQIKDSYSKGEYYLNQAREEIIWAGYIVYGVRKLSSIF